MTLLRLLLEQAAGPSTARLPQTERLQKLQRLQPQAAPATPSQAAQLSGRAAELLLQLEVVPLAVRC